MRSVALLLAALVLAAPATAWVNTNAKRRIYLATHVVRVRTEFSANNDGSDAASTYDVVFADGEAAHISVVRAEVDGTRTTVTKGGSSDGFTTFTVALPSPVAAGASANIKVAAYFTHVLTPFPAEITQEDAQLVLFNGDHFVPSPYTTAKQVTTVKLPAGAEDFSDSEPPVKQDGESIKYGPYADKAAFSTSPMRIHFTNNSPFATFTTVDKEIEVSHWGNIAVEEQYDLKNTGAALKGGFARIDYQMRMAKSASFSSLTARLPVFAADVYYRDIIGNISTSHVRHDDDSVTMEIEPRFPLFGGWKTQWYQGYNLPTEPYLTQDGDTYALTVDFGVPFENAVTDELVVKVVLPERASVQSVEPPVEVDRQADGRRFTYMDSSFNGGRPVLFLKAFNLVDKSNGPLVVTYTLPGGSLLAEPLMLVTAFFLVFMSYSLLSRLDFSLTPKSA